MKYASVILDIPTQALDAPYTYLVPDSLAEDKDFQVQVGCAVLVPFGARQAIGFVIELSDCLNPATSLDPAKIKPLVRALSSSYFDEEGAACAQWLSKRYVAPLSSCVRLFTPPGGVPRMVRTKAGYWKLEQPSVGEVDDRWVVPGEAFNHFTPRAHAIKQAFILQALRAGELRVAELNYEFGSVAATLKALEKKGVVSLERRRRMRGGEHPWADARSFTPSAQPVLTSGQLRALRTIQAALKRSSGDVIVVDGVTGSGKTEVYLQAIEEVLAAGRTACVLVPEIALTPQTVGRFRGRFGDVVAVMHSRMSAGERYDQWDYIRSGAARVVVGARSALFTPLCNVGLIVVDEEHEGTYKQESAPRYHARQVATWMARRAGAVVVLGSATPSIDTLYECEKKSTWHRVELPERANGKPLPQIQVIDMAREFGSGSRSMFSRALSQALIEELRASHKVVLLLNQRGFAKFMLCRTCGFVPECPSCSLSLTFHERGNVLVCHHCGYHTPAPPRCPKCHSPYLKKFGAGTQRVEAELRVLLDETPGLGEGIPIVRMDADTTKGKGAHQRLLESFASFDAAVLLGTQMIAKGLDFNEVTLVGVINADTMLKLPDYRAAERTFSLIEQVAGRAGRANLPGRVLVQTYEAEAVPIQAAAQYDRTLFLRDELPKRKLLKYPPYVRMANVLVWGKNELEVRQAAQRLYQSLHTHVKDFGSASCVVLPATPCVFAKLRGTYRWHLLVKSPQEVDLSALLLPFFRARKTERMVNMSVDIDPEDLL